ncbi:phenylalanine--tRNA ligase subunit alpha [bacterium]|nr:phenylalanine--tRNA ligase subunit alpha [bacterium]
MIDNIQRIQDEARSRITSAPDTGELERLRVHYLGKKGLLTSMMVQLRDLTPEKRREAGAMLNRVKQDFESFFTNRQDELERKQVEQELANSPRLDVTLPGYYPVEAGSLHPITRVMDLAVQALQRVGFSVATGPEVETEFFNFEALNTPEHHPARDMQDTFYIEKPVLLRSHTSPVQIRAMKAMKPPLQIISVGKVYRADYDQTHTPMFHQIEGLMVDEKVSFSDLKGTMHYLIQELFGARPLRFRPSYFPFVEPGAEVDMLWGDGKDRRGSKAASPTDWLEIGGCGMVHPNVLRAVGYDPDRFTGFAFGMGLERIAMIKYGIQDIRAYFENDRRLLEQF